MHGLAEDTKRLSLSSSNNNNNSSNKTTSTKMATTASATTNTTKSSQNLKNSNKNTKVNQSFSQKQLENKTSSQLKGTGVTNNVTGALQKQQKAQQLKQQKQKCPGKVLQQQQQQQQKEHVQSQHHLEQPHTNSNVAVTSVSSSTSLSSASSAPTSTSTSTTITLPKASHANTKEEIAGGVQDTIYLCNFRVSVDGEWLCLKELQDIDVGQENQQQKVMIKNSSTTGNTSGYALTGRQRTSSRLGGQKHVSNNKRYSGLSGLQSLEDNGIMAIQNLIGRRFIEPNGSLPLTHLLFTNKTYSTDTGSNEWSNLRMLLP